MTTAVVVDDVKVDQRLVGSLLESRTDLKVVYASNGQEALARMEPRAPDLVITDLQMPTMDGLELVEAMRHDYPAVPVILMTAHGSEDVAAQALQNGAASYVPKRYLARDLIDTVERLLAIAGKELQEQSVLQLLTETEWRFVLSNDLTQVAPLISSLRRESGRMNFLDETDMTRVGVALDEAIVNAIQHGNLDATAELSGADMTTRHALLAERRLARPYCDRSVYVSATFTRSQATYVIRDEGKGFDVSRLPDPSDPSNLEKASGRGLVLIRTFMDEVRHNDVGNQITMIKRANE